VAKSSSGQIVSKRTAMLRKWLSKTYGGHEGTGTLSSIGVAAAASQDLGFTVTANRVARELDRQGISFRRQKGDPPPPVWNRTELIRARQDHLEARIRAVEIKVFGKAKAPFRPRSKQTLKINNGTDAAGE
jgi:hypothetical protein